jgi:hypothetical protein
MAKILGSIKKYETYFQIKEEVKRTSKNIGRIKDDIVYPVKDQNDSLLFFIFILKGEEGTVYRFFKMVKDDWRLIPKVSRIPLYGIENLAKNSAGPILIVPNPKHVDYIKLFSGKNGSVFTPLSPIMVDGNFKLSDFSPLKEREVLMLSDNTSSSIRFLHLVKRALKKVGIRVDQTIKFTDEFKNKKALINFLKARFKNL